MEKYTDLELRRLIKLSQSLAACQTSIAEILEEGLDVSKEGFPEVTNRLMLAKRLGDILGDTGKMLTDGQLDRILMELAINERKNSP